VALVAASLLGSFWSIYWFAGLVVVVLGDRAFHRRLLKDCEAGAPPPRIRALVVWTVLQSAYGNVLAVLLWFAPNVPGETLAVIFICGGLANAAATLRSSIPLSVAGVAPTVACLLGLPVAAFLNSGGRTVELVPLVGALLMLGFGFGLWRSLLASDVAHVQAEEAAARERRAAAAAAAARSDTIRAIDDGVRTPMMALAGAVELVRRTASATPRARASVASLTQALDVLRLAVADLANLDNPEHHQMSVESEPTDLHQLVGGAVDAFRAAAYDKNLELFLDVAPSAPLTVKLDGLRVRQILYSLLSNAVRYTSHGGVRLHLSAQPLQEDERIRLRFVISDTGAGMSRSQLALVFGGDKVSDDRGGVGLVSSIRLARQMGGHLAAKSELGQGSVFCLTIDAPLAAHCERNAANARESPAPSRVSHSHTTKADQPSVDSALSASESRSRLRSILARQ
jgi:signal transduction histidine kinase